MLASYFTMDMPPPFDCSPPLSTDEEEDSVREGGGAMAAPEAEPPPPPPEADEEDAGGRANRVEIQACKCPCATVAANQAAGSRAGQLSLMRLQPRSLRRPEEESLPRRRPRSSSSSSE